MTGISSMNKYLGEQLGFKLSGIDRRVHILSFGWLVNSAGFAMVIPFISIYFHRDLHISLTAIGLFFGVSAVLRTIPQPFAGWLSDRFGRVPILVWSQILRAMTFFGVGYMILQEMGFWPVATLIGANYVFGAMLHPAANAMVADSTESDKRLSAFAWMRIAGNLGWALGPAMGGFIAHESYGLLFFVAGILTFASGLFFFLMVKETTPTIDREQFRFNLKDILNLRQNKRLFEHCLITLVLFLAVAQLIAALSVYSVETIGISQAELGTLYAINGFMVVLFQLPISHSLRKFSLTNQLAVGSVIYTIGYFLVGIAAGFGFLVFCMVVITIGEMVVSPPAMTIAANLSPAGYHGRYMGIFGLFQAAGWSLGPTVGGILLDVFHSQPLMMWTSISLLGLAACGLYVNFGHKLPAYVNNKVVSPAEYESN